MTDKNRNFDGSTSDDAVSPRSSLKSRQSNFCGSDSNCKCSQSSVPGVISVDECPSTEYGVYMISNITTAKKIAIGVMFSQFSQNILKIRLIFSNNQIEEIIDFNSTVFDAAFVSVIEFENNPKLVLGHIRRQSAVDSLDSTIIRSYGVSKVHDYVLHSTNLTFSDFSASFEEFFFGTINSIATDFIWSTFAITHLLLEGKFVDFSNFSGIPASTITIRNVRSLSGVELAPEVLFPKTYLLRELTIYNSSDFHLPKNFFYDLYNRTGFLLSLELDIWNIQQYSIGPRTNLTKLEKLNQVMITDELRDIIGSNNDTSKCANFCQSFNGSQLNCSDLHENERRACGICVKNIIGEKNLAYEVEKVCKITKVATTTPRPKTKNEISTAATSSSSVTGRISKQWKVLTTVFATCCPVTIALFVYIYFFQSIFQRHRIITTIVQMIARK